MIKKWLKVILIMSVISFISGAINSIINHLIPNMSDLFSFYEGMIFMAIYLKLVNKIVYEI